MSERDKRLQDLMTAGLSYDDAERTVRKEEAEAQQLKSRERSQSARKARQDKVEAR